MMMSCEFQDPQAFQEQYGVSNDPVTVQISLDGSSRAERFLGSFDEISRLTLDIDRNYGSKRVLTDFRLKLNGAKWTGTVDKLIVGFDYTITGHAYKEDNASGSVEWVEIFRGDTQRGAVREKGEGWQVSRNRTAGSTPGC